METQSRSIENSKGICLTNDENFSENHIDSYKLNNDEENLDPSMISIKVKLKDRRSSMKRQKSSRRRRRSSARFLRIVPDNDDNDGVDGQGGNYDGTSATNLGEVYRNAIRMNAENRINASNSWNLNLIDHLDRFVAPELRSGTDVGKRRLHLDGLTAGTLSKKDQNLNNGMESTMDSTLVSGVNFTKASCTLDASVKIYSYRVDDVHLTSYKVLANLNRTDNSTSMKSNRKRKNLVNSPDGNSNDCIDSNDAEETSSQNNKPRAHTDIVDTLELNTTNINVHKIDAAFDIDPLFHKMSKTFDEGGAKGLLLANLNVGRSGCNIVFDSTLDDEDIDLISLTTKDEHDELNQEDEGVVETDNGVRNSNSSVDISNLIGTFESLLSKASGSCTTVENMLLVPQLASLRNQYAELGKGGFVEDVGKFSKRYASSLEDEDEADKSIHLEAIERSRVSQADLMQSQNYHHSLSSNQDGDFIERGIEYDDNDDDVFGDIHDGDHRFSSSSFEPTRISFSTCGNTDINNFKVGNQLTTNGSRLSSQHTFSQARVLLDAIASGDISTQQNNHYEYFNSHTLKTLTSGNLWAGAEHWKKMASSKRVKNKPGGDDDIHSMKSNQIADKALSRSRKKKQLKMKKKAPNILSLVSVSNPIENLEVLIEKPKRKRGKNIPNSLQLTKAAHTKYSNVDNLLPMDAELQVKEFISLFSRPKIDLIDFLKTKNAVASTTNAGKSVKVVGFSGVETWETDDSSGNGIDFGNVDDEFEDTNSMAEFVVPDLEDIRRVDKINIGYATVARKIDVKRLKRDLWNELEQSFVSNKLDNVDDNTSAKGASRDPDLLSTVSTVSENHLGLVKDVDENDHGDEQLEISNDVTTLSFQETVRDMEINQSQSDVTIPFYFICVLHLCNEKGLALESSGLDDFVIHSS